jgi:hypothetical protein
MHGDHRTRFCKTCNQNVHDLSELTTAEAVELVTAGEKPPCLRLFKRPDGRVMTRDCLTRRERAWKWLNRHSTWAAALFALVFMAGCGENTCVQGDMPFDHSREPTVPHDEEHATRPVRFPRHAQQPSAMDGAAHAAVSAQQEAAAGQ